MSSERLVLKCIYDFPAHYGGLLSCCDPILVHYLHCFDAMECLHGTVWKTVDRGGENTPISMLSAHISVEIPYMGRGASRACACHSTDLSLRNSSRFCPSTNHECQNAYGLCAVWANAHHHHSSSWIMLQMVCRTSLRRRHPGLDFLLDGIRYAKYCRSLLPQQ